MPLPILQTTSQATPETLIRLFHQTEQRWSDHLGEPTVIDTGTAFVNSDLPGVHDANRMFGAAIQQGSTVQDAVAEVESHYASHQGRCHAWIMNPSAGREQTEPLIELLLARGHHRHGEDILYLAHLPREPIAQVGGLKIIPARASFRHAEELLEQQVIDPDPETARQLIAGGMLHLDDPHYEALLAIKDGVAVAKVGVLTIGEIGRIEPLFVAEPFRRQGVAQTMMSRALEICMRSLFKHIFLSCNPDNTPAQTLYAKLGFKKIGEIVSYIVE